MHKLFDLATWWEYLPLERRNPIEIVKVKNVTIRTNEVVVLSAEQFREIAPKLPKHIIEDAKLAVFHLELAVHLTRAAAKEAEVVVNFASSPYVNPYIISTMLSVRLPLSPTMRVRY